MSKNMRKLELWIRGVTAVGLYCMSLIMLGLSFYAMDTEVSGVSDPDAVAGGLFSLALSGILLAATGWVSRRWKAARILCLLGFMALVMVGLRLAFE